MNRRAVLAQQQGVPLRLGPPASGDPWRFWSAATIAAILGSPIENVLVQWPLVVAMLDRLGIADRPVQIAAIATIGVEAGAFRPVREAYYLGEPEPAETWRQNNLRYWPWFGRGLIQLTWLSNYQRYSPLVSALLGRTVDLVARPDDALLPDVSAAVFALYFLHHGGDDLQLIPQAARAGNWARTRVLVNGGLTGWDEYSAFIDQLDAA
jgi:hypothetical protein